MHKECASVFIDILFPKTCHICSKDLKDRKMAFDDYICSACTQQMRQTTVACCRLCGAGLITEHELKDLRCHACAKSGPSYQKLLCCYIYEGATKELIHRFKYENRPYLAKTVSRLMQKILCEIGGSIAQKTDVVVPIPLHPTRQREREFNQSELIAKELCISLRKPLVPAIKRTRHTQPQVTLEKDERLKNLSGAFSAFEPSRVKGKHCLLIDDVVTTTATVREASSALKEQGGALSVSVLAFAKG
ncbi:MAG: ComF family protein [Candidatus Omnitrophica bacterium]|nr:ComF family protein [Candidatus Omnitrophota bacterium]